MKWFRGLSMLVVIAVLLGTMSLSAPVLRAQAQTAQTPDDLCAAATKTITEPATREFKEAGQVLKSGVDYWAVICTDKGAIYLDLLEDKAPITVNSFVFLAQQGYFNNTTFHRVIPGFMAQGGDPTGTGSGGPGYEFKNETDSGLKFDKSGVVAMANAGADTNGSQFFITYGPQPHLDGGYSIFGQVFQGIGVAELLLPRDPQQNPTYEGSKLQTVVIVEDPKTVSATPDGPPDMAHFQKLLEEIVATQLNEQFVLNKDVSHTYDLEAEAASWQATGGDKVVEYMRAYLSDHQFTGAAELTLKLATCPTTSSDQPIWGLGLRVADYTTADNAKAVVFDDARAKTLEDAGVFESHTDPADLQGRVFTRAVAADQGCGPNGRLYHLELPYGRYVLTSDLILDSSVVNDTSSPTAQQYVGYLMQELMQKTLSGVLDRGNAAAQ